MKTTRLEKEIRRANEAEAKLSLLKKAVSDAQDTAFAFKTDILRTTSGLPAFAGIAASKVYDDIAHAYMVSIRGW